MNNNYGDLDKPGSHNGRELELMLAGIKPMASFVAEDNVPSELVGDANFLPYVENGQIIKFVERHEELAFEIRIYCLPDDEWRGKLKCLISRLSWAGKIEGVFNSLDREKIDGFLLGYTAKSVETHTEKIKAFS